MKTCAIAFGALLSAGCSLNPDAWHKPGSTFDQRAAQIKRCEYEVKVAGHHMIPLFIACMEAAGYKQGPELSKNPNVESTSCPPPYIWGMRFGSAPLPGMVEEERLEGGVVLRRPSDQLTRACGATAKTVVYAYEGGTRLDSILIEFLPADFETVKREVSVSFGPARREDTGAFRWQQDGLSVALHRGEQEVQLYLEPARPDTPPVKPQPTGVPTSRLPNEFRGLRRGDPPTASMAESRVSDSGTYYTRKTDVQFVLRVPSTSIEYVFGRDGFRAANVDFDGEQCDAIRRAGVEEWGQPSSDSVMEKGWRVALWRDGSRGATISSKENLCFLTIEP